MEKRGLHITNTIIVGFILLFFTVSLFGGVAFLSIGSGPVSIDFSFAILILFFVTSLAYFLFLTMSFKKCNLDNSYFKSADFINLINLVVCFIALMVILMYFSKNMVLLGGTNTLERIDNLTNILGIFGAVIFEITFIISIIGFFEYKKKQS